VTPDTDGAHAAESRATLKPHWRVRVRVYHLLLLSFFCLSLLPVIALDLLEIQRFQRFATAQTEHNLALLADAQGRRVSVEFERLADQAGLVASRTQMRISLRRYLAGQGARDRELIDRILRDALASIAGLKAIHVRAPSAEIVTAVGTTPHDAAVPDAPGDRIVRFQRLPSGQPALWVSAPLMLDGATIGSIHLLAGLDDLHAVLGDFSRQDGAGETLLLLRGTGDGPLLYDARGRFHGLDEPATARLRRMLSACPASDTATAAVGTTCSGTDLLARRPTVLPEVEVVVHADTARLKRSVETGRAVLLTVSLAIVVVAVTISIQLARSISGPARNLRAASDRLRYGDYSVRVREQGWGEFRTLTRDFNDMADALERQTDQLQGEVAARKRSEQRLITLANTDPLTGLYNRRHFLARLDAALARRPEPGRLALLFIDLNEFKPVNDRHGHDAGDDLLRIVGERLQNLMRESDPVGRLGGDEFAALLTLAEGELTADAAAQRIADALSQPIVLDGLEVTVSCAIGIALNGPACTAATLVGRADGAMYQAKRSAQIYAFAP